MSSGQHVHIEHANVWQEQQLKSGGTTTVYSFNVCIKFNVNPSKYCWDSS